MWYNATTGQCQSNDPAEGCFGELAIQRREGWEQVGVDFIPPKTKQQLIAEVNQEYDGQLNALREKIVNVQAMGLSAASLIAQRPAILAAKKAAMQAVIAT